MGNDKLPERVWITWDDAYPWPTPEMGGDEYVRADLLATVRKEEREAAFKVLCSDCAEGDEPTFSKEARWCYHELSGQEIGCSASKLRIATLEAVTEK